MENDRFIVTPTERHQHHQQTSRRHILTHQNNNNNNQTPQTHAHHVRPHTAAAYVRPVQRQRSSTAGGNGSRPRSSHGLTPNSNNDAAAADDRSPNSSSLSEPSQQSLTWSVASFQQFFPLLDFAAIQQAMISVVPNFVVAGSTTQPKHQVQPTHEQVQLVVSKLNELSQKRLQTINLKARIEERQTERRYKLFYERPASKSEKLMYFKTQGEVLPPPAAASTVVLPPHLLMTTAPPSLPSSQPNSRPMTGHGTTTNGGQQQHHMSIHMFHSPASRSHTPAHRRPSVNLQRRGLTPLFTPASKQGTPIGTPHITSSPTNLLVKTSSILTPSVANSFFSLDFLAPVPPRNPLGEWLASTPAPEEDAPTNVAMVRPPSRETTMLSPRFNRHAKLLALSPERSRNREHMEEFSNPESAFVPVPTLSPSQENILRHFLLSIDCPFFSRDLQGHSIPYLLNSFELNQLISVMHPKYTPPHELVPAIFAVMNDTIEVNQEIAMITVGSHTATTTAGSGEQGGGTRTYDSWQNLLASLRAVFQLGREKYVELFKRILTIRTSFGEQTGLRLSDPDVLYVMEHAVHADVLAPAHLVAVLSAFMVLPPTNTRTPVTTTARKFRTRTELVYAARANLAATHQQRAEVFSIPPTRGAVEAELARRVNLVLDRFILSGRTIRTAVVKAQALAKKRKLTAAANLSEDDFPSTMNGHPSPSSAAARDAQIKTVVEVLPLQTPKQTFQALLASLHAQPNAAGSTLLTNGSLETMMSANGGNMLDLSSASLRAFFQRLDVELRFEQQQATDAAAPTQFDLPRNVYAGEKPIEAKHVSQMLASLPPACGGIRLLQYLITREGFMRDDSASGGNGASGSNSFLPPFVKIKPLLRLIRERGTEFLTESKRILTFLDPRGGSEAWRTFFPRTVLDSAPTLTLQDVANLLVAADCARPSDALHCLRSMVLFGRAFDPNTTHAGNETLLVLAHTIRAHSRAQEARVRQDGADLAYELELWFAAKDGGQRLFAKDVRPQTITPEQIRIWLGGINSLLAPASFQLSSGLNSALPVLLESLSDFIVQGSRFESIPDLTKNLNEHVLQRASAMREVSQSLYTLASTYSKDGVPNSLLIALQTRPGMAEQIYLEGLCGRETQRTIGRLCRKADIMLNKQVREEEALEEDLTPLSFTPQANSPREVTASKSKANGVQGQTTSDEFAAEAEDLSAVPLCTWQSVREVIDALQACARLTAGTSPSSQPSSLLSLLQTHCSIVNWSKVEFLVTLANHAPEQHPFLSATIASALDVSQVESLYDRLYSVLPLSDMSRLPALLWDVASNLPLCPSSITGEIKLRSLDELATVLLTVRAAEVDAASTAGQGGESDDAPEDLADSPIGMELISCLEEFFRAEASQIFTPESGVEPNKLHATRALEAILQADRALFACERASAASTLVTRTSILDPDILAERILTLISEQGLMPDFASFQESLQSFSFTPPNLRGVQTWLKSSQCKILTPEAKETLDVATTFRLLADTGCLASSGSLLSLIRSLELDEPFDEIDQLSAATRTIRAIRQAREIEEELERSVHETHISTSAGEEHSQIDHALQRLGQEVQKLAPSLFSSQEGWTGGVDEDDDDASDSDEEEKRGGPSGKTTRPSTLPSDAMRRLLDAVGSSSPNLALATAMHFLHYLSSDYSRSYSSSSPTQVRDLRELEVAFAQLRWRKEWIVRRLIKCVKEKFEEEQQEQTKTNNSSSGAAMHPRMAAAAPLHHEWSHLYALFTATAPGFDSLDLLPLLQSALPDYRSLESFIDGLRLLGSQVTDHYHEPCLTELWASFKTTRKTLVDQSAFECTVASLKGLWRTGRVTKDPRDLQAIIEYLDAQVPLRPRWRNLPQMLSACRSALYSTPSSRVLSVLHRTGPLSMVWNWNTERRTREICGGQELPLPTSIEQRMNDPPIVATNFLRLAELTQDLPQGGQFVDSLLDRILYEGSSFETLEEMFEYLKLVDLLQPSGPNWRTTLMSHRVDTSQVPGTMDASFARAALIEAHEAHAQELEAALKEREQSLRAAFEAERALIMKQQEVK